MCDGNFGNYVAGICLNDDGDGAGSVYMALHKPTNTFVAVKRYFIDEKDPEDYSRIQQEIITTRQLQHPNVLPYINAIVSGNDIYVISPLMSYGSCSNLIKEYFNEGFPELAIAFITRDVLYGLDYIHKKGLIHRALKASHILISGQGQACICGMRYSCEVVKNGKRMRTIYSFPESSTNNLKWLSPELLKQDLCGYNEKSDIYSLGMTMCELANGFVPFSGVPDTIMLTEKIRGSMPQILDKTNYSADNVDVDQAQQVDTSTINELRSAEIMAARRFSDAFHEISELCLESEPQNRPGISQILGHPFFKQCRKTDTTLLNILESIKTLDKCFQENKEDETMAIVDELGNLELETCQWDFENT